MIPRSNCPHCNKLLWDDYPPTMPTPGCYAICVFCTEVSEFDNNLQLKKADHLTDEIKEAQRTYRIMARLTNFDLTKMKRVKQ